MFFVPLAALRRAWRRKRACSASRGLPPSRRSERESKELGKRRGRENSGIIRAEKRGRKFRGIPEGPRANTRARVGATLTERSGAFTDSSGTKVATPTSTSRRDGIGKKRITRGEYRGGVEICDRTDIDACAALCIEKSPICRVQ